MIPIQAARASGPAKPLFHSSAVPEGFAELAREHLLPVDLFFGGRKLATIEVYAGQGMIRFKDPHQLFTLIPNLQFGPDLQRILTDELPSNSDRICVGQAPPKCRELEPEDAGVIFDEDHFRIDLFVNPKWLRTVPLHSEKYLQVPTTPPSITSALGLALSASSGSRSLYNIQNRTIIGFRNGRVRTNTSYASHFGLVADTAVAELDVKELRYSGGLFWAPGVDLTGERRILGIGAATQLDTRSDRESVRGTPIVIFLSQTSRVDVLIDGRLVDSRAYEAGNNVIDTSSLPEGSYSVLLRVMSSGGAVREERRFFSKDSQIAAAGEPILFGYAGLLADTKRRRLFSVSNKIFYEAGIQRRLNKHAAFDLSVIGVNDQPILEAGGWLIGSPGRVRAAALLSPSGDYGALLQFSSSALGRLSLNFDLRSIKSRNGRPLVPFTDYAGSFEPVDSRSSYGGSFTQLSSSVGYRLGSAFISLNAAFRKERGQSSDYTIGPDFDWTILNTGRFQAALHTDAQLTRHTNAGYAGFRLFLTSGRAVVSSSLGGRMRSSDNDDKGSKAGLVEDTSLSFSASRQGGSEIQLAAGVARDLSSTVGRLGGTIYSPFATARADISHEFRGGRNQLGVTLQTNAALTARDFVLGGRNLTESALIVSVDGQRGSARYDILVNEEVRANVSAGERRSIFLEPYRSYTVRLRATHGAAVAYDEAGREFTLFPGNVHKMRWHVDSVVTVLGQAYRPDGAPVANAFINSRRGVGVSESDGRFQIDAAAIDRLKFTLEDGAACSVDIASASQTADYLSVGKVVCQ